MFDPAAPHGIGRRLATAFFRGITGETPRGALDVRAEVQLGEVPCAICDGSVHACNLDLVVIDERHAIVVEHKIGSGDSGWVCRFCGRINPQLVTYSTALDGRRGRELIGGRRLHRVYLTPSGGPGTDAAWAGLSHGDLAKFLAGTLNDLSGAERHSAAALLIDLNSGRLGTLVEAMCRARALVWNRGRPRFLEPADVDRLHRLVSGEPILAAILGATPTPTEEEFVDHISPAGLMYLEHVAALARAREDSERYLQALWPRVAELLREIAAGHIRWRAPEVLSTKGVVNYGVKLQSEEVTGVALGELQHSLCVLLRDHRQDPVGDGLDVSVVATTGRESSTRQLRDALRSAWTGWLASLDDEKWTRPDASPVICMTAVRLTGQADEDARVVAEEARGLVRAYEELMGRVTRPTSVV
jgi:hypothetical protein